MSEMTIGELWQEGNQILSKAGIEEAKLDSRYLLEWIFGQDYSFLILHLDSVVSEKKIEDYRCAIQKRCHHVPLQYITGQQEFMGFSFQVNESVLIPRQDTEILVETVIEQLQEQSMQGVFRDRTVRILDMCCGSGCIGLSIWQVLKDRQPPIQMTQFSKGRQHLTQDWELKKRSGTQYQFVLADISPEALQVAKQNAEQFQADVCFVESNLWEQIRGRYQIIISNPPYIPSSVIDTLMPEVKNYEPRLALDGAEDGLAFYRRIIEQAGSYLEDDGYVFFEIGFDQAEDVGQIFVDFGFEQIVVKQDLAGLDRVIYARKGR